MSPRIGGKVDIDFLRGWIGRREISVARLGADLAQRYHATFDLPGAAPTYGETVPRLFHFCLGQPAVPTNNLGVDGHPERGGFLPPVPYPRRMWAGGQLTFHRDLSVGDTVTRTSVIEDVTLKTGRAGALCFVTVAHDIHVKGALAVTERQDIVYRHNDGTGNPSAAVRASEPGSHVLHVAAGPQMLFRYSALTFNSHRIHYDRRYALEVEGYAGLVVHGPLQAALLCNFASELRGAPPTRFAFRGVAPLYDDVPFTLQANADGDGLKLWTAGRDDRLHMSAQASWL